MKKKINFILYNNGDKRPIQVLCSTTHKEMEATDLERAPDREDWCVENFGVVYCDLISHWGWFTKGHTWGETYGTLDQFGYEGFNHNGPKCTTCGFNGCWHCTDDIPECEGK